MPPIARFPVTLSGFTCNARGAATLTLSLPVATADPDTTNRLLRLLNCELVCTLEVGDGR